MTIYRHPFSMDEVKTLREILGFQTLPDAVFAGVIAQMELRNAIDPRVTNDLCRHVVAMIRRYMAAWVMIKKSGDANIEHFRKRFRCFIPVFPPGAKKELWSPNDATPRELDAQALKGTQ